MKGISLSDEYSSYMYFPTKTHVVGLAEASNR